MATPRQKARNVLDLAASLRREVEMCELDHPERWDNVLQLTEKLRPAVQVVRAVAMARTRDKRLVTQRARKAQKAADLVAWRAQHAKGVREMADPTFRFDRHPPTEATYDHSIGDEHCGECWGSRNDPCKCGGRVHSQFFEEMSDGFLLIYQCDCCGSIEEPKTGE